MRSNRSHRRQVQRMGLRIAAGGTLLALSFGCNFSHQAPTSSDTTPLVMVTALGQELRSVFEGLKPEPRGLMDLQLGKLDAGGACEADPRETDAHNRLDEADSASSDRSTTVKVRWVPRTSPCIGHNASMMRYRCTGAGENCFWRQCYFSGNGDYHRGCKFYARYVCSGNCPEDSYCRHPWL